jgi:xylulokinase
MTPSTPAPDPDGVVLAVDLGTTALKVGLITFTGRMLWCDGVDLETTLLPSGGAVQDAACWWTRLLELAARGLAGRGGPVAAVAITGQWASTVPVDADGEPVGPCLLWMDSRGGVEAVRRVGGPVAGYHPGQLSAWVRRTGGAPALDGADPLGHRWYLQAVDRSVHDQARWLLEPVDYLGMRLTGRAAATQASMVGAWLTDNRILDPGRYDDDLVRRAGLDVDKLPPLLPNGSVLGPVRPDVAARLGLGPDVPVVAGVGDAHSTALGSGAVELYEGHLSLGTTSWVSCHVTAKKTDVFRQVAAVPSTLPGRYLVLNNHETSGRCLHWLRGVLAGPGPETSPADAGTAPSAPAYPSYLDLDRLAGGSEPGAGGLLFTPWLAGERTPVADRNARGGFHNLSLTTTRADLVRAVLEGVAYNDRWTLEAVEKFVGRRLDQLRLVGGGARSDLWCQIHADVLDRTMEQVAEPESTGLRGAAFAAALALGVLEPGDLRALVPIRATYTPTPERVAGYARLYAEFPGLYRRQRRMFARLNGRRTP